MKVVTAYLLAVLGGNASPTADNIKSILGSVGAEADEDRIEFLLKELKGKDITEVIAAGREKFASVPSGGNCVVVADVSLGAAPAAAGSVGAEADEDRIEFLLKELKGKDITEVIAAGREKFASVPSGGSCVVVADVSLGAAPAAAAAKEEKKEEKKEPEEESDDDMGFSLFD